MISPPLRSFLIRIADESRTEDILAFHNQHLTEHLWPRTFAEFKNLAEQGCLYEALETSGGEEKIISLCYIVHDNEPASPNTERAEFGGVYVTDDCRGCGIATALGIVAISNHFVWDPPKGRMIAHVHEHNPLPRGLLEKQLGFIRNGEEIPPAEAVPASMKRNAKGQVVGHLFEFQKTTLLKLADWIEKFSGTLESKTGKSKFRIALPSIAHYKADTISALRDLGTKK